MPRSRLKIAVRVQVRTATLAPGDEFLILACDGIWDVLTNQEVGAWAVWCARAHMTSGVVCAHMTGGAGQPAPSPRVELGLRMCLQHCGTCTGHARAELLCWQVCGPVSQLFGGLALPW